MALAHTLTSRLLLLLALQVRQFAADMLGDGFCPSEDYNTDQEVDSKAQCYFPTESTIAHRLMGMFCYDNINNNDAISLMQDWDLANNWCPYPDHEDCNMCLNWQFAVGCARMKGDGFKYNRWVKDVPINFVTKWHSRYEVDGHVEEVYSRDWEPVRMWVGCEKEGDKIKPVEISIEAPNLTDGLEKKYLPNRFLRPIDEHIEVEKLKISAQLHGLRVVDDIPDIPYPMGLQELDISNNAFGANDGWPTENFYVQSNSWDQLIKLDMSYNGLTTPYPNRFTDTGKSYAIWNSMTSLTHISLAGNKLTEITPCTFGCDYENWHFEIINPNLKSVDLSNNELDGNAFQGIKYVYPDFDHSKPATKLRASEVFKGLGKLRNIDLSNNKLTYLPPKIFAMRSLKNLQSVDIRGNPLECLPMLPKLEPKMNLEWNAEGPFYWDGGELPTCMEKPQRMEAETTADSFIGTLQIAGPVVVVFAGVAIALSKQKGEVYETMA